MPTPHASHKIELYPDELQVLAIRSLPDRVLPAYLEKAERIYDWSASAFPGHLARLAAFAVVTRLLPAAAAAYKPLAVAYLMDRLPETVDEDPVIRSAYRLLKVEVDFGRRDGTFMQKLNVVRLLVTRQPEVLNVSFSKMTLATLVLRQGATTSASENLEAIRRKQLELVKLMKRQCARLPHSITHFADLRPTFIEAALPDEELNPAVRKLNEQILKELAT